MNDLPRICVFIVFAITVHALFLFAVNQSTLDTTFAKGKTSQFSENIAATNEQIVYVVNSAATHKLAVALKKSKIKINPGSEIEKTETETTTTALNTRYEVVDESREAIEKNKGNAATKASSESSPENKIDDLSSEFIENPAPEYPYHDMVLNNQGTVTVTLSINKAGNVVDAKLEESSGFDTLDYRALLAVKKWKYNTKLSGLHASYPIKKTIEVDFKIDE